MSKGVEIKYHEALELALSFIGSYVGTPVSVYYVVVKEYGWVFHFQSLDYMETGNWDVALGDGNAPVIVFKSGETWNIPTSWRVPDFLTEWEKHCAGEESWIISKMISLHGKPCLLSKVL